MRLLKKLFIISIFTYMVSVASCGRSNSIVNYQEADYSQVDTIRYDYVKNDNEYPRDSAINNIRYIPLETTPDNPIGLVDRVFFCDSTIVVVDFYIAKKVFTFDYNGKYLGSISALGNGHHEYRHLTYVCQRPDNKIAITDAISFNIMIFDERGNFIKNYANDMYHNSIEFIDMDNLAINTHLTNYDRDAYKLKQFAVKDVNMRDKYQFGKTTFDPRCSYVRYYNLYSFNGKVYCNVNFEDCIYELGADSVKAKYILEFGPENVTHHHFYTKEDYYALKELYPYYDGEFVELKDYTYICFRGEEGRELIYDHTTKQTYALTKGFNNPMVAFFRRPMARIGDNTLVSVLNSSEVFLCRGVLDENNKEVNKLFSSIKIDSNPIIFFYDVSLK